MSALAAAYLLVLQALFGAFAAAADAAQLDAFGNVICTHDGAAELPGDGPHGQPLPPCCALGCGLAAASLAPPPDGAVLFAAPFLENTGFAAARAGRSVPARRHLPSNPRAPPAAA